MGGGVDECADFVLGNEGMEVASGPALDGFPAEVLDIADESLAFESHAGAGPVLLHSNSNKQKLRVYSTHPAHTLVARTIYCFLAKLSHRITTRRRFLSS